MANDANVRSLSQILLLAKTIIDAGLSAEFIKGCQGKDNLFVVSTESSRMFVADFIREHHLAPNNIQIESFSYGGDRCS